MVALETLRKLEGLHTIETIMKTLHLTRQSSINLVSKLQREQYTTIRFGGGNKKRMYNITLRKQRPRQPGMFDILNKYSPHMKIAPWFDHQVHGEYTVEDAIVDAVQYNSFRISLVCLQLFQYVKSWTKLRRLAINYSCWRKIGALYEVARINFRVVRMPKRYAVPVRGRWVQLSQLRKKNFPEISNRWHVYIPFNKQDIMEVKYDYA